MVGTPVAGEGRGNRLTGTAAPNYDMDAGGGLDIAFSGITDVDRNRPHTSGTILFPDVPLGAIETFETGRTGNCIQGAFYGAGHVEAAGIFDLRSTDRRFLRSAGSAEMTRPTSASCLFPTVPGVSRPLRR